MRIILKLILAQALSSLVGTVTLNGATVPMAAVTLSGNNRVLHTTSDESGHFAFANLPIGSYDVGARSADRSGHVQVDVASGGVSVTIAISRVKEIGHVGSTVRGVPVRRSGTDTTLNSNDLTRAPYGGKLSEALLQLPGVARGANGVVHTNGDHGVINYVVDGVSLPQALNRQMGSEIDPNDISFLDVIEGAYPAQYGLRFGDVLNITTKAGAGVAGYDASLGYGSYADAVQTFGYHTPFAHGGGLSLGTRNSQTTRGLDPPNFNSPHNQASDTNQYLRFTVPGRHGNYTDVTLTHSFRTYQVPNDVANGAPATTDDSESQNDAFASLQWHHPIGDTGAFTFGPAIKISRIRDFGDRNNDFAYIESLNVAPPPFGAGGSSSDCANAAVAGSEGPTTCAYSLTDDKTAVDYIVQGDYVRQAGRHEIRAGASFDSTRVLKNYAIAMQPNNFIQTAPVTFIDDHPNLGTTYTSYIQDSWRMSPLWEADFGARYDFFSIRSASFERGFGQVSPRLKIARFFGKRASAYGYVGRFFEPFSFENVDPAVSAAINAPLEPNGAQFDLLPERDTMLELGGHVPLGAGSLGFRVWQKNANDLIDDTQVGVTLLHQDINYELGRTSQQALSYVQPLRNGGRAYVNIAHTIALNANCKTQLLAPCFGAPTGFTPADHDQRYSVSAGVLLNGRGGGWFSANGEYGSGLSSAGAKSAPHLIFSAEQGVPLGTHSSLSLQIDNIFNDRYYVTVLNAQGNHWAAPRTIDLMWQIKE